jgi:glutathione peroxidase
VFPLYGRSLVEPKCADHETWPGRRSLPFNRPSPFDHPLPPIGRGILQGRALTKSISAIPVPLRYFSVSATPTAGYGAAGSENEMTPYRVLPGSHRNDNPMNLYDLAVKLNSGESKSLADYRGKVLLIVNVASKCGFTPQYAGLQELYSQLNVQGLEVLGFPCDQFGHQEPGSDTEIKSFCDLNYGVSFPLFSKIKVNGPEEDPLYTFLKSQKGGFLRDAIKWNFTKFLVDRQGKVVGRYAPSTAPADIRADVEKELARGS